MSCHVNSAASDRHHWYICSCCVPDVEGSVIGKLVLALVKISLLSVGYLLVVLSCNYK
jgi:hypothetical protein